MLELGMLGDVVVAKPPAKRPERANCDDCKGAGVIIDTSEDIEVGGRVVTCPTCHGSGKK